MTLCQGIQIIALVFFEILTSTLKNAIPLIF